MRLEWDDALNTQDPRIDAEHQRLFALFNDLDAAASTPGDGEVRQALEMLTEYVATHFAHEEERMVASGYPESSFATHVTEHRALTEEVRERVLRYRTGGLTIEDLVTFLREWLRHHVIVVDCDFVRYLRASAAAGSAPEGSGGGENDPRG